MTWSIANHNLTLYTTAGNPIALEALWRERPLLVFFLRHFGCAICRAELLRLRKHDSTVQRLGGSIVAISPDQVLTTELFAQRHRLPFPILSDPGRSVYQAFGLAEGSLMDIAGPAVLVRQAREALRGNIPSLNPRDPIRQLGGIFVVGRDGGVHFSHIAQPIYNYPPVETYLAVLHMLCTDNKRPE